MSSTATYSTSPFYDLAAELPKNGEQLKMADYKGQVVLIVNVASKVGRSMGSIIVQCILAPLSVLNYICPLLHFLARCLCERLQPTVDNE